MLLGASDMKIQIYLFVISWLFLQAQGDESNPWAVWPSARLQYTIHPYFEDDSRFMEDFYDLTRLLEERTCVRFMRRRPTNHASYVVFIPMIYVTIPEDFRPGYDQFKHVFLREPHSRTHLLRGILRVLGVQYEHLRKNRDEFIEVRYDHVINQCRSFPQNDIEQCRRFEETWLYRAISCDCIIPPGYTMFRWDRDSLGGGVAIIVTSSLTAFTHGPPYLGLKNSERDKLNALIRKTYKLALGLPPMTSTEKLLSLGIHNTWAELVEAHKTSQIERLKL
ncbi:uncharacterized protein [Dermacentor albipictus]|uniref:uncharacterized protein n=1 Tax=Dermacentor albipictus TaxID=60249 RepID=UPI0038FCFEE2